MCVSLSLDHTRMIETRTDEKYSDTTEEMSLFDDTSCPIVVHSGSNKLYDLIDTSVDHLYQGAQSDNIPDAIQKTRIRVQFVCKSATIIAKRPINDTVYAYYTGTFLYGPQSRDLRTVAQHGHSPDRQRGGWYVSGISKQRETGEIHMGPVVVERSNVLASSSIRSAIVPYDSNTVPDITLVRYNKGHDIIQVPVNTDVPHGDRMPHMVMTYTDASWVHELVTDRLRTVLCDLPPVTMALRMDLFYIAKHVTGIKGRVCEGIEPVVNEAKSQEELIRDQGELITQTLEKFIKDYNDAREEVAEDEKHQRGQPFSIQTLIVSWERDHGMMPIGHRRCQCEDVGCPALGSGALVNVSLATAIEVAKSNGRRLCMYESIIDGQPILCFEDHADEGSDDPRAVLGVLEDEDQTEFERWRWERHSQGWIEFTDFKGILCMHPPTSPAYTGSRTWWFDYGRTVEKDPRVIKKQMEERAARIALKSHAEEKLMHRLHAKPKMWPTATAATQTCTLQHKIDDTMKQIHTSGGMEATERRDIQRRIEELRALEKKANLSRGDTRDTALPISDTSFNERATLIRNNRPYYTKFSRFPFIAPDPNDDSDL